ncbi:MAG: 30S ribosomal protein S11 [Verrucomicrobiae bacterium]|nr:30S ribosomal protein S11 [Verrucomicrobiae bacterium]
MSTEKPENEEEKQEAAQSEAKAESAPKKAPAKKVAEKAEAKESPAKAKASDEETNSEADASEEKPAEKKGDSVADLLDDGLTNIKIRRAKGSKNITHGVVHVTASFNNTKVSVTDQKGNVISWSSAGKCNFRGSRKSTAYAAQVVTQDATRAAMAHGLKEVEVHLKGPGMGRDSAVRALQALGIIIVSIVDKTPVPHNGCRPPKRRRV